MGRSTVHYADNSINNTLKTLHKKLRPAGTPVERVEYIIELLLLRIFEQKITKDDIYKPLKDFFASSEENERKLFSYLTKIDSKKILEELNITFFPFYANIVKTGKEQHSRFFQ